MNRELVNPDDPQMTAYALGELSLAEAAAFEARLLESPLAQAELASMREVMSLLGEGLRGEWEESVKGPTLTLLESVEDTVVVAGDFRPRQRNLAAVAAVVAILLVGATTALRWSGNEGAVDLAGQGESNAAGKAPFAEMDTPIAVSGPRLFLAEEVTDLAMLDLAIEDDSSISEIDASYLDMGHVVPVSFHPGGNTVRGLANERVDSYLPPLEKGASGHGPTSGMIERRLGKEFSEAAAGAHSSTVLVSGYVTMGGPVGGSEGRLLAGFRPVSISGNPVEHRYDALHLVSELNGLQMDLSKVIGGMPAGSSERVDLERVLGKSEEIVSQLRFELSRQ